MTVRIQPSPTHKHGRQPSPTTHPEHYTMDTNNVNQQDNSNDKNNSKNNNSTEKTSSPDQVGGCHVIYVTSHTNEPETDQKTVTTDHCSNGCVKTDTDPTTPYCGGGIIEWDSDDEAVERSKRFCWGLCCMHGCVWGIIGAVYFFFLLPAGFMLIMYGTNKSISWAIAAGAAILGVSTCGIPSLCLWIRWYRRKKRDRRNEYRLQRNKQLAEVTFDNPIDGADANEVPA